MNGIGLKNDGKKVVMYRDVFISLKRNVSNRLQIKGLIFFFPPKCINKGCASVSHVVRFV